ncbi:hypothetical protein COT77_02165, partial [Candidatus Berkelbacteria bacterium CG10_big_fil_rev_8_21_14_0_10_41_12]
LSYQTGENIFLVRSVDNAGNTSASVQTTYYYSNSAPTKPTDIAVDPPGPTDTNAFSLSWTAPAVAEGEPPVTNYGYSINAWPTANNITWTGSDATTLGPDAFATQQGENTFYIVAKNSAGSYALDAANVGSVVFYCQTIAPPIPINVSLIDSSNRALNNYMLTLQWRAGTGQDSSTFDHYLVERSTDGTNYSSLATTASTAYIDASGLNNTTKYYYRVKAVDNAGSTSAASGVVSRTPTGKYTTPPTILSGPTASAKATSLSISWVTNRSSSSAVRFGSSENSFTRSQIDPSDITEHSITIVGLDPGTLYYYQVQSLDEYRDYSSDSAWSSTYTETTLAAPGLSDVDISNITLTFADVTWETTTAASGTLDYGTSISYGNSVEQESGITTQHTAKLEGLSHSTTYHFKISGTDIDGNTITSDDYVFDTLPIPKISQVGYQPDNSSASPSVEITWRTNVPTTSTVEYVPKGGDFTYESSKSDLVTDHKAIITDLSNNTEYSVTIFGSDQFSNVTDKYEFILQTPLDARPPKISNVIVESSNLNSPNNNEKAQIAVSWKTDESATSIVEYGEGITGTDYTKRTNLDTMFTNSHLVIISDLAPSKTYHLRVVSQDQAGNSVTSSDNAVVSGQVNKSILDIIIKIFNNVFGWMEKLI